MTTIHQSAEPHVMVELQMKISARFDSSVVSDSEIDIPFSRLSCSGEVQSPTKIRRDATEHLHPERGSVSRSTFDRDMAQRKDAETQRRQTEKALLHVLAIWRLCVKFLFSPVRVVCLAGLLFVTGCQTPVQSLFTVSGPAWRMQQGQALWRPRQGYPEIAGDLVMATDDTGRCLILFDKSPMSLVTVQTTPTNWLIMFPQGHMSFSGHGRKPVRFGWFYLHAALAGEPLPKTLQFERKADGNWRLANAATGETLEGFLPP